VSPISEKATSAEATDRAEAGDAEAATAETVIAAGARPSLRAELREIWEHRGLMRQFIARDIKVRYKQTVLGVVWIVLQPLLSAGLLAMVRLAMAARVGGLEAFDMVIFFMAGFVPWISFSAAVNSATVSLSGAAGLVKKVYFPRAIVPLTQAVTPTVDFLACFALLLLLAGVGDLVRSGAPPAATPQVEVVSAEPLQEAAIPTEPARPRLLRPAILLAVAPLYALQLIAAIGLALILAPLNARYRDVRYLVAFFLQLGMFATVLIGLEEWSGHGPWMNAAGLLLTLSPMTAVIDSMRAVVLGRALDWALLAQGTAIALGLLAMGVWVFRRNEPDLVDVL
jgi:lipopolysaccharide transport system permease protein